MSTITNKCLQPLVIFKPCKPVKRHFKRQKLDAYSNSALQITLGTIAPLEELCKYYSVYKCVGAIFPIYKFLITIFPLKINGICFLMVSRTPYIRILYLKVERSMQIVASIMKHGCLCYHFIRHKQT